MNGKDDIVTPCCGETLIILTREEGLAYISEQVPDEIMCSGETCFNSWDETGVADKYNK